jgi:hypothetical protein
MEGLMKDILPEVYFGKVKTQENWRGIIDDDAEEDDDELLAKTPQDVIDILGFDPLEFENE